MDDTGWRSVSGPMAAPRISASNEELASVTPTKTRPQPTTRSGVFASAGIILFSLGVVLGISGHNIATLFSSPTEVRGTVTEMTRSTTRRGTFYRFEVSTDVGQFYMGRRTSRFQFLAGPLFAGEGQQVTVSYSELTGGLIAVEELDQDRRTWGQILWPAVALGTLVLAAAKTYYDFTIHRDGLMVIAVLSIYLFVGPLAGVAIFDVLSSISDEFLSVPQ